MRFVTLFVVASSVEERLLRHLWRVLPLLNGLALVMLASQAALRLSVNDFYLHDFFQPFVSSAKQHMYVSRIDRGKDSEVMESAHNSTDSEQQKRSTVSLNFTTVTKEKMTDKIKMDLNRSEAHVSRLLQQIRDHLDTIQKS